MDPATLAGIGIALAAVFVSMIMEGGNPASILLPPAMLIVFAATGLLRGMQNTVTPLWIAGMGFGANALLNWAFIYGLGWGIAGSAAGTAARAPHPAA